MNVKGIFLLFLTLQLVVLLTIVLIFNDVGDKTWIDKYKWIFVSAGAFSACVYIIWTAISSFRIPLAVHIIFAVIMNIVMSIFCGVVATFYITKWCLASYALAILLIILLFPAAVLSNNSVSFDDNHSSVAWLRSPWTGDIHLYNRESGMGQKVENNGRRKHFLFKFGIHDDSSIVYCFLDNVPKSNKIRNV
uniref:Uncharacterized protein n=1 Tax=Trichobilharzia regenti TaxID=157069 RepID=A0AA85J438_TRIRE|nr:unnamed protein product [Trichobilharzia regenti]